MRIVLLFGSMLAVLVNLTAIQAKDDSRPNGLKALDHFAGDYCNPVCRKRSFKENTARILKNRCILGSEISQPGGVKSSWQIETDDAKSDFKKIQGTWAAVALIEFGKEEEKAVTPEDSGFRFLFEGDKITFLFPVHAGPQKGSFKLDPTKTPKSIEMTFPAGSEEKKDETIHGIYKFDGDTLIICFEPFDQKGPTEFKSKAGSETTLITFKKLKK